MAGENTTRFRPGSRATGRNEYGLGELLAIELAQPRKKRFPMNHGRQVQYFVDQETEVTSLQSPAVCGRPFGFS
jgi:hypothetical protein